MEHTDQDISAIEYGNKRLDDWLYHEPFFIKMILKSEPMRVCMVNVFHTLVKLGEIPPLEKTDKETLNDAVKKSKEWNQYSTGFKGTQLIKAILSITKLAEKRLELTIGVL